MTGRSEEGRAMLEAANVGRDTLAVLPVLIECIFLGSFPASQNRS